MPRVADETPGLRTAFVMLHLCSDGAGLVSGGSIIFVSVEEATAFRGDGCTRLEEVLVHLWARPVPTYG